jgi:hypothetical protein
MNAFLEFLFSKARSLVGKNTRRSSRRTHVFLLAAFLIALIGMCIPDASTHADPLVPSDIILAFHIVDNGKPYLPTVNVSYMGIRGSTHHVHYFFSCAQNCYQFISSIWTGVEVGTYSLLVEVDGGKSFTISNFNIYYTPRYDVQTNPTVYRVAVDVGQQSCLYIPNSRDNNFRIDGCSRKQPDGNDRATESADSIAIATAEAQRRETDEAFYRTDTILYLATASAEVQGTKTAAERTYEKALTTTPTPSITVTFQPLLVTAANQALSLAVLPSVQPTGTIAPPVERSVIGVLRVNIFPFLSSEYIVAIVMAVLVESAVAFLLIRIIFKLAELSSWRIFFSCLLINFATIPCAWRIMGLILRVFPIEYFFIDVVLTETLVIIVEALWYRIVLPIRFRQALLLSFCANSASYFGGVILFGF